MTVALDVQRTPPRLIAEVRAACKALNLEIEEWAGGIPRTPPQLVMTALEPGERRLPDELCQLIEASPGVRAIVFANEPLVKPRITLNQGRVVILAPPVDRVRLIAVARSALGIDERMSPRTEATRRFEILRRQYWVAWARGVESVRLALDEQAGMTVSIGSAAGGNHVARILGDKSVDARGSKLVSRLGQEGAIVHLDEDAAEWQIYWPQSSPIWICSPQRLPTRWEATSSINGAPDSWLRLAAFPGDQVIGLWSASLPETTLALIRAGMLEGAPETLDALDRATEQHPTLAGIVVELR